MLRIESDASRLATGVAYVDHDTGLTHIHTTRIVVLCANGAGAAAPAELRDGGFPNGLANGTDIVGRNLMMHPHTTVTGLFDDRLDSWQGPMGQRAYSLEFAETGEGRGFVRGAKWQPWRPASLSAPSPTSHGEARKVGASAALGP